MQKQFPLQHTVNNEYECIYKTLAATYITRMMRAQTGDYKHDNVVSFFSANPMSQKSRWIGKKLVLLKNGLMLQYQNVRLDILD